MDSNLSPISLNENDDVVRIVALNERQEETTDNLQDLPNTQYVLEVEPAPPKKSKGKQLLSQKKKQVAAMKKHPMFVWLENSWQSDVTLPVMKPWLTLLNKKALEEKDMKLYHAGQTITKIMKEFISYLKENQKTLTNCGFANFEEWACDVGFSTTSGKLQAMDWAEDLNEKLFSHYSDAIMELAKRKAELEEMEETEYSSLENTKNISTSSTTARTPGQRVGASTSKGLEITPPKPSKAKQVPGKMISSRKEKSQLLKRKILSDSENEEDYAPGTLFLESQASVEDESEPDVDIQPKKKQKKMVKFQDEIQEEISENEEETMTEEGYASMLANLARAHSLVQSTGKIAQTISLKDDDGYISITSPGERGFMLMKLELYPFKDCVKLQKNQYWTKRNFSSLAVISGPDSPAYKMAMALRTQITKDIMKLKGVKTEKKSPTGWKSG